MSAITAQIQAHMPECRSLEIDDGNNISATVYSAQFNDTFEIIGYVTPVLLAQPEALAVFLRSALQDAEDDWFGRIRQDIEALKLTTITI